MFLNGSVSVYKVKWLKTRVPLDGSLPKKNPKPVSEISTFNSRSICNTDISPTDQTCCTKIRSMQHRNRCNINFLGRVPHALRQIKQDQVTHSSDPNTTLLAQIGGNVWYLQILGMLVKRSILIQSSKI